MFDRMKKPIFLIAIMVFYFLAACRKTPFTDSEDALLLTSIDTVSFGKIFTGTGSVTQSFKIFNANDRALMLSTVALAGNSGVFQMNLNGTSGSAFNNVEISANDSVYVFVSALAPLGTDPLPFLVRDSIQISWNGNDKFVQLRAEGQNAVWLRNTTIVSDSVITNDLPVVVQGPLTISDGVTLTIEEGTKFFFDANAALLVNGKIRAEGNYYDSTRIEMTGSRLDQPYASFPGSWQGIVFNSTSFDNKLNFVTIKNAVSGIEALGDGLTPQLQMEGCILDNHTKYGLFCKNSVVAVNNSQISNCGVNNVIIEGGLASFIHCTIVTYSNIFISHDGAVVKISDYDDQLTILPINVSFTNCILTGYGGLIENEIVTDKQGADFTVLVDHCFYNGQPTSPEVNFKNSVNGTDPLFLTLNFEENLFDFSLQPGSPCLDIGLPVSVLTDLRGNIRNSTLPDLGCFESN